MGWKAKPRYEQSRNQWVYRKGGKTHYLCSGANNEAEAWRKAAELDDSIADTGTAPKTVAQAVVAWLAQNGKPWHRDILRPFAHWASGQLLDDVHAEYLHDYQQHLRQATYTHEKTTKRYAPSTIRRQVQFARGVLHWAHVRKYMLAPVPDAPTPLKSSRVARDLGPQALFDIFEAMGPRQRHARNLCEFILCCGCRPEEACLLKYDEIHGNRAELLRGKTFARTGNPRILHLSTMALKLIDNQPTSRGYVFLSGRGKPYTSAGLRCIFKRAASRAGYPDVTGPYQLRHSWAQYALDSGLVTLDELGEALGHETGSPITRVYARVSSDRAAKAVKDLPSPLPSDPPPPALPASSPAAGRRRGKDAKRSKRRTASGRSRQAG